MGSVCGKEPTTIGPDDHVHREGAGERLSMKQGDKRRRTDSIIPDVEQGSVFWGLNIDYEDLIMEKTLGQGTFGQVSSAHLNGKRCAVKKLFLPSDQGERDEMLDDFQREMQILRMLDHPFIIHFYGACQVEPNYCLITELCEGSVVDLLMMVKKRELNVTWSLVIQLALQCAEAVNYLHSLTPQILHRDLKVRKRHHDKCAPLFRV
jgi:sterile alpha motif and leucine zipper-containing kinase AZK